MPTPVGPRNMNEPIGRFGSCKPGARAAHGLGDSLHGLALADDAPGDLVFHAEQLVALAFQHLVDRNAGPARHDVRDMVGRHGLLDHRALACPAFRPRPASSPARGSCHRPARRPSGIRPCAARWRVRCGPRRAASSGRRPGRASASRPAIGGELGRTLPRAPASSFSSRSSRSFEASSFSSFSASRSIFSCMMRRSISSSASGLESTCMRSRAAASSTRSIALSGRKRSVM